MACAPACASARPASPGPDGDDVGRGFPQAEPGQLAPSLARHVGPTASTSSWRSLEEWAAIATYKARGSIWNRLLARLSGTPSSTASGSLPRASGCFLLLPVYTRVLSHERSTRLRSLGPLHFGEVLTARRVPLRLPDPSRSTQADEEDRQRLARTTWSLLLIQAAAMLALCCRSRPSSAAG